MVNFASFYKLQLQIKFVVIPIMYIFGFSPKVRETNGQKKIFLDLSCYENISHKTELIPMPASQTFSDRLKFHMVPPPLYFKKSLKHNNI